MSGPKQRKLKLLMRARGVTQKELSMDIGCASATLSRKIVGIEPFRWDEVQLICLKFGIKNPFDVFE